MIFLRIIFVTCIVAVLWQPALAQQGSIASVYGEALQNQAAQGLVTCSGLDCNFCELGEMTNNIINWLFGFLTVLAVLVFAAAGFKLVTSGGSTEAATWAKQRFTYVVIGILLMLSSWLIVDTILRGLTGQGMNVWGSFDIDNCGYMADTQEMPYGEFQLEDAQAVAPTSPGSFGVGGVDTFGFPTCEPSDPRFPDCGVSITTNDNMNPIFDPANGGSNLVRPGAAARMQETLQGPFAQLQAQFGRPLVINDAIAKSGTSRETKTPNSRHFFGDALDISLIGMDNEDRVRLFREAQAAGFTGFGFGNNILHIDRRPQPTGWAYGNATYGGQDVSTLISQAKSGG